ncbi:MAG: YbaB/EbfC family nucleoid-associated protein [Gemmatales bacterium]|nr:YbaB/EbfC family nucleoid-associated protein [Gemmatales bacterium]MDW7994034.1 YbaB/EbfC family nucleoid-associated protein [Gemmatales bacterium]
MFDWRRFLEGLQELPILQRAMKDALAAAERTVAEGEAGGGLVRARANGRLVLTGLYVDESLLRQPDRDLLEELILAACNQALERVRAKASEQVLQEIANLPMRATPSAHEDAQSSAPRSSNKSGKSQSSQQSQHAHEEHD